MRNKTVYLLIVLFIVGFGCIPKAAKIPPIASKEVKPEPLTKKDKSKMPPSSQEQLDQKEKKIVDNTEGKKDISTREAHEENKEELPDLFMIQKKEASEKNEDKSTKEKTPEKQDNDVKKSERIFSFSMRNADIRHVIEAFSSDPKNKYSYVLDPNVRGAVTIDLKNVTLEKALDAILTQMGYHYKIEGEIVYISIPKMETRVFTLDYITTVREGENTIEAKSLGQQEEGSDDEESTPAKISTTEKADLWSEIEKGIEKLISKEGRFSINKQSSFIVVTAYPKELDIIADFIQKVEKTIQRQVLIEATIIELTLLDKFQMGIQWEQVTGREGANKFAITSQYPREKINSPIFTFNYGWSNIDVLLDIIQDKGKINILSRPRITTLNNQSAIIKVGTEEVYFTIQERYTENNSRTLFYHIPEFYTIGFTLNVTPQINASDEITLHIHPIYTEKTSDKIFTSGEATSSVPVVSIRETNSVVKVKSGEMVVIGGLILDKKNNRVSGVPLLMNLPVIGHLFQYKDYETEKTELIIALKPTILYENDSGASKRSEMDQIDLDLFK